MRLRPLLLAAVLGLAACSSGHDGAPSRLVPWDGAVPAQLRVPRQPPAAPCRAARLRVVGKGFQFAPTLSGGMGTVTLRNAGPAACRLTGRPQVRIVGATPAPRQVQSELPPVAPSFPQVAPPDTALEALRAGARATLTVDWRNWCLPRMASKAKPVPPTAVRITLPGTGGSLNAGYNAVPGCDTPGQPSTLGVRPFLPAPLPASPPWHPGASKASITPPDGSSGSLTGTRGAVVRYAVQLRNVSTAPITFDRCPLVVEMLVPASTTEAHKLNCAAAGPITPGGSLRFEMHIAIPPNAPLGNNGLFWELDPTGAQGPQVVSRIVVVAK
jgi:hypothetical protein